MNAQCLVIRNSGLRARAAGIVSRLTADPLMEVIIRPHKSKRSIQQNSMYWAWINLVRLHVADSSGQIFGEDEVHEWLKAKFLKSKIVEIGGEAIRCRKTTTKLNTAEMSAYLNAIDMYSADRLGLILPHPDDHE